MISFPKRIFTSTQDDVDLIKLPNESHVTAHLPAGIVTAGATKMRFKTGLWSFAGNENPTESWLYDYSMSFVEIDLIDTAVSPVLPDEVGKSPGVLPVLTDNSGNIVDLGVNSFEIYFSIKVDSIR